MAKTHAARGAASLSSALRKGLQHGIEVYACTVDALSPGKRQMFGFRLQVVGQATGHVDLAASRWDTTPRDNTAAVAGRSQS
ncbi:hypothetical protein [Streptomyces sp. V3I7]|uniref:hypothetical protein n=1 Tax=Streptomyces sp. V3I7 TaxID=3042278 RepID=UPI00277D3A9F|nr:hypothetical protein [Streptomyces sp. V3I7]MDQ0991450.1 hypothetical protein [Streptomyces sp. V3I7]